EQPLAGDTRTPRERALAQRRDVGAKTRPGQQPQDRDVRKGFRPVDDEGIRRSGSISARPRANRVLAVDDERRAELFREGRREGAADRQLAAVDPGAIGKELEQLAQSVHQSGVIGPSPGPVCGAPNAITSAPSGPPSRFRIVSLAIRTASNGFSSMISLS